MSAMGHKQKFFDSRQNVRYWGQSGRFSLRLKESANSQKRTFIYIFKLRPHWRRGRFQT